MVRIIHIFYIISFATFGHSFSIEPKKTWKYEIISLYTNSSDESLVKIDIKLKRISRGVYGLDGSVYFNMDIEEGDDNMIEATISRSTSAGSDYKPTPFGVKKQHVYDFINTFYKDVFMKSASKCSNLPVFKDKFQPPIEKKTYVLNNCVVSNEGLPPVLNEGYYKILASGYGTVQYVVEGVVKVENDM